MLHKLTKSRQRIFKLRHDDKIEILFEVAKKASGCDKKEVWAKRKLLRQEKSC